MVDAFHYMFANIHRIYTIKSNVMIGLGVIIISLYSLIDFSKCVMLWCRMLIARETGGGRMQARSREENSPYFPLNLALNLKCSKKKIIIMSIKEV